MIGVGLSCRITQRGLGRLGLRLNLLGPRDIVRWTCRRLISSWLPAYFFLIFTPTCKRSGECLQAHPMGNFSISHYSKLTANPWNLDLLYIIDTAEIPTFQEKRDIDQDGDGNISAAEKERYVRRKTEELLDGLRLLVNGTRMRLQRISQDVELRPGGLNLPTLRLTMNLRLRWPTVSLQDTNVISYQDTNFAGRVGWKEVIVQNSDGLVLLHSSVPSRDLSHQLTAYPEDPRITPPEILSANFSFSLQELKRAQERSPERSENAAALKAGATRKTYWAVLIFVALLPAAVLLWKLLKKQ